MSHSSSSSKSSHATAWTLSVLVALPILYLLGLPPLLFFCMRAGVLPKVGSPPKWAEVIVTPYEWTLKTPLKEPLEAYLEWNSKTILDEQVP